MLRIDKRTTQGWLDVEDVNFLQLGRKLWIQFPDGLLQLGTELGQVILIVRGAGALPALSGTFRNVWAPFLAPWPRGSENRPTLAMLLFFATAMIT